MIDKFDIEYQGRFEKFHENIGDNLEIYLNQF